MERHLRSCMHIALHQRSNKPGGETHDLRLVLRDRELKALDELHQDRLHLDDAIRTLVSIAAFGSNRGELTRISTQYMLAGRR